MAPENTAAADAPTDDQIADSKPGLSDEEKAALAAEDDQAGDGVTKGDEAKGADDPPQDAAAADSTGDAAAGPPDIPRGNAANVDLQPSRNVDMEQVGQRLTDLDVLQADLDKKYDEEDLDAKDYLAQSRLITQEQSDLNADVREAHFVSNANRSLNVGKWQDSVNNFVDANAEFTTGIMQGALNAALNELYGDDANLGSSHHWYLETAKRAVLEQISPAEAAAGNPSDAGGNTAAVKAAKLAADKANDAKGKLPKTLGDIPVADEAGTSKDPYADVDNLTGIELEKRLSLMTPEQEQEYLRAE